MVAVRRLPVAVVVVLAGLAGCSDSSDTGPGGAAEDRPGAADVVSVTDGDTIRVRVAGVEERVRLVGIDTPETQGRGGLRECFGAEATDRTRQLLPGGTRVRLVLDVEARDRYGRLLAYVYRASDGLFVNLALAREGYAAVLTVPPNVAHADDFVSAAAAARSRNAGLWGRCGGPDSSLAPARPATR